MNPRLQKKAALEELCFPAIEGFVRRLELIVNKHCARPSTIISSLRAPPNLFETFINSRQHLPQAARHRVARMIRRYETVFDTFLREAVSGGEFRSDSIARPLVQALLAACDAAASIVEPRLSGDAECHGAAIADAFVAF